MGHKRWWEIRSAADDGDDDGDDDGPEVVEQNDDGDWIDRFNFNDYRADRGLSSTDAIWNRYGYSGSSFTDNSKVYRSSEYGKTLKNRGVDFATSKRIEAAQRLVQGFVDTFALDNPLRARFSTGTSVGGDAGEKAIVVSHRPLLDPTLDTSEAHRIMTAQAASAAARARYGGNATAERTFGYSAEPIGLAVAKILDDYRIDASFRRDYPGYEDVYAPAQAYVAKGYLRDREAFALEDLKGASIANAALNFAEFTDWSGREEERDWWTNWAATYAFGSLREFAVGVDEAVKHLNIPLPPKPSTKPDKPTDADDEQDESDDEQEGGGGKSDGDEEKQDGAGGGESDGEEGDDESAGSGGASDEQDEQDSGQGSGGSDSTPESDEWDDHQELDEGDSGDGASDGSVDLPIGLGEGVSLTGMANGQSTYLAPEDAQEVAEMSKALAIGRDENEVGEVYWTANGFETYGYGRFKIKPTSSANGYIRRAFTRSRTAHYATERGHLTGRIDNRSLPRIASDDYRLFSKRVAPSETHYRVWLLIDNSGSMGRDGALTAGQVAASLALAVRHVPNVALDVWAWTTGIKLAGAGFSAVRVYADGDPISKIGDVGKLPQGGTPDGSVLSWATREIRKQCRPDETPVILVASDGHGSLKAETWTRDASVQKRYTPEMIADFLEQAGLEQAGEDRVAKARKAGIKVMSVAIGAGLDESSQATIYGKGNYLKWKGDIKKMAKPLGDLLARVASNRA